MSDNFTTDEESAEKQGIWWAGIVFATTVTFVLIAGLLVVGTYVLNDLGSVDLSYWLPTVAAAVLTGILVTVALKRGDIKYDPR